MEITLSEDSTIEPETIKTAIELQIPIEIYTYSLPEKTKNFVSLILSEYMKECKLDHLCSKFDYCVTELILNAVKANTKRVYFNHKNLKIDSPADYEYGMKYFRKDVMADKDFYLDMQKLSGLFVKFSILIENDELILEVTNNSLPTVFEYERMITNVTNSHKYTIEEIAGDFIDESEGAGVGLNSICLSLESVGVAKDNFKFFTRKNETVVRIVYPFATAQKIS